MSMDDIWEEMKSHEQKNKFVGVTPAIVTSIDDPERLGRIKVKLINRDTAEYETDFIRVMTPMTGKEWGFFFLPEVGDEVLVAFSDGEMARPYVIGSLWNETYQPPVKVQEQKNTIRKIRTKNGHEIFFQDEQDKDAIHILTPKKLEIKLEDGEECITITDNAGKNRLKIDVKAGTILLEGAKKIDLKVGGANIVLDANGNSISIESQQSIKMKSAQIQIEAQSILDIKSNGTLSVSATGPTNIKGAIVKVN